MDFQRGNRLFLLLPPNLHFISFSASSPSFSVNLSSKPPYTLSISPIPEPQLVSNHPIVNTTPPPLTPHTHTFLSHSCLLFLYLQSGPVIIQTVTQSAVCLWMEDFSVENLRVLCYQAILYTACVCDVWINTKKINLTLVFYTCHLNLF